MPVEVECDWCGEKVERCSSDLEQTEHTFCSETCQHKWQSENWRSDKRDKIRLLRKKEYSFKEIGDKLEISPGTAYRHSSDIDIELEQTENFPKRRELYREGLVDSEIAEKVGVSQEAICNWRNRRGLSPNGRKRVEVECDWCGEKFEKIESRVNRSEHHFCSIECYGKWRSENIGTKVKCDNCGKLIKKHPYEIERGNSNFCSRECCAEYKKKRRIEVECDNCGKTMKRQPSDIELYEYHFCSESCQNKWQEGRYAGEDNPAWRGGNPPYYGANWREQRRKALERDNHTCQLCGSEEDGKEHSVHHIVPFREFGRENYKEANKLSNLITLCQSCHANVEWRDGN